MPRLPIEHPTGSTPTHISKFADVARRQSEASLLSASRLVETLRDARSLDEVIAVQSKFIVSSAQDYANLARQLGELLTTVPMLTTPFPVGKESLDDKSPLAATPLAARFTVLVGEAEAGLTEPVSGLSRDERRKALFDIDR